MEPRPGPLAFLMQPMHRSGKERQQREMVVRNIPQNMKGPPAGFRLAMPPVPVNPVQRAPPLVASDEQESVRRDPDAFLRDGKDALRPDTLSECDSVSSHSPPFGNSRSESPFNNEAGTPWTQTALPSAQAFRPIRSQPDESQRAEWRRARER